MYKYVTTPRCFLLLALAITAGIPSVLHAFEIEKYWPGYATLEAELNKRYLQNKKFRINRKDYSSEKWKEKLISESQSTIICSEKCIRSDSIIQMLDKPDKIVRGMMFDQDELYYLQKADDKYTVKGHNYNTENQMELYRILSGYSYAAPLSFNGKLDLRREFQSYSDPRFANLRPAPKSMENSTLNGKPVHKLTVLSHGDRSTIAFYDPANSGALLRYESSHSYDFDTLKVVPIRTIGTISYVDSPLGYPVPKEHKCWYQKPDGTIIRQFEIEYLEYENYTPKSDDFDLEKHYGIKALPRPEAAGPAPEGKSTFASTGSRWGRYLWYIAGALAVTTVGLFVFVWRKRRKNSGSPKSA